MWKPILTINLLSFLFSSTVSAQLVEPNVPSLPESDFLPPPSQLLQTPEHLTSPDPVFDQDTPGEIQITRFEVTGSTVFTAEQFAEVTKPFTEKSLSFAELLQVQDAITKLYVEEGYITSGAFIAPQTIKDGVVEVQILEGIITEIKITGNRRLNSGYIRSRIEKGTKTPLNINRLLEELQLLQLNPLIENISAELVAGVEPGTNILAIIVDEERSFFPTFGIDNGRSPSVGTVRGRITLNETNVTGWGDSLYVSFSKTDGSNVLDEVSYTLPVNRYDGTIKFAFSYSDNEVVESPFDQIDIKSNSRDYTVSFRQPVIKNPTQELALGLEFNRRESFTSLLGIDFPLSPGANEDGETRLSIIRFFQEWTNRTSNEVFALRSQFSFGINAFNANSKGSPDGEFFAWRGQGQYLRLLAPDTILLLRTDAQITTNPLVPLEQFALGGIGSVRGYRQDLFLADNGFIASAEVRLPIARIPDWNSVIQIAPFFDVGTVWNLESSNPDPQTLTSLGLGLIWQIDNRFTARLDWGIPLVDLNRDRETLQEKGLVFSVEYSP
jgi:hemolysin activation/secretion protein